MPIDTSFYGNQVQPQNPLERAASAQTLSNSLQQNQLLQTANQEQKVNLQNLQFQQQAGQMQALHTNADGTINFVDWAADPGFKQNPYSAKMLTENLLNSGSQSSSTVAGEDGTPATKYGSKQSLAASNNPTAAQAIQDKIMQDTSNAHPDAAGHYDNLNRNVGRVNTLLNKPTISNSDITNTSTDMMNDGIMKAPEAANFVTTLSTPDGSPVPKGKVLQAAVPLGQAKQALVKHVASTQQPPQQNMSPTIPLGTDQNIKQSADKYKQVSDDASNVPNQVAAFNEVTNLNEKGAQTGTILADLYKKAGAAGFGSGSTSDPAVMSGAIGKYLAQTLIQQGMPSSDARLQELQSGNVNDKQLPGVIKELAPILKATAQGASAKANFYDQKTNFGKNMGAVNEAENEWRSKFDPRFLAYNSLPKDSKVRGEFLHDHPDMQENFKQKQTNMQSLLGGQ